MKFPKRLTALAAAILAAGATSAPPAVVSVNPVKSAEQFDLLTYPARVVSKVNTTILAETDGIVSKVVAPLGRHVLRGQNLLIVSHTDPVYQYAPMLVRAPVSGIVSLVEVTEGSQITKGQRLASVTDPSQVRVTVEVPAEDLAIITKGLKGSFSLNETDLALPVKVQGVSPFVDPATGTATCELEPVLVTGKTKRLPLSPGLIGEVQFKAGLHSGISVPDYSVIYRGNETFVRVLTGGKARQVAVRLGRKQQGRVEVLSGLKDNDSLIERSSRFIADGEEVSAPVQVQ